MKKFKSYLRWRISPACLREQKHVILTADRICAMFKIDPATLSQGAYRVPRQRIEEWLNGQV